MVQVQISNESITTETFSEEEVFVFPVSFAQQRLWFLDQFEPGSPFYNIPTAVRLTGQLDLGVLQRTLNEIVRRHEVLRTTFTTSDGEPVQVISPVLELPLPVVDLSYISEDNRYVKALELANEEARQPFDLTVGPLLRAKLLQLASADYIILITMHHIISDGWSIGVFVSEVVAIYSAFSSGRPSPLPELSIQYADFSVWQREWLQGEVLDSQLAYWKSQLGKVPVLELPTDYARPTIQTSRGAVISGKLSEALTANLNTLARSENVTLFMVLLGAFQVLLYRYTSQTQVSVGSPIANRNRAEIERLIGFFVNTLVLKTDLSGNPTFRELLQRVREVTLGAYANQDLPFEMLVDALQPQRDMSHNPLFQVMFILQNTQSAVNTGAVIDMPGVSLNFLDVHSGTSTFDLTLSMAEDATGMDASIEYNTDLFETATIERMVCHFMILLEDIVVNSNKRISELSLLPPHERQQLLVDWNATAAEYPSELCVHELIEMRVCETPDATAVVMPSLEDGLRKTLTYQELNEFANQLAHHLRQLGVGPEQRVGICLERSLEMVVAVLGVLKAGGAYVPLDPLYPQNRLAYMLEDSAVTVLLTQTSLLDTLPPHEGEILCLDPDWYLNSSESKANLPNTAIPVNLAYMIYTSGSTGKSKGTMVEHRNLVNAYFAWEDVYQLDTVRTHLQMANFAFDVFSGDYVRALCSGGRLVLCPREWLLLPDKLYNLMRQEQVTCGEFVPVVLRHLIQYLEGTGQRLDFMRVLPCGSDSWYVREYRSFLDYCGPDTRLINSFGLTEATIDSSYFEGPISDLATEQMVPIGRPFANMQLYIMDAYLQPLPIGVPGELYVGGHGVTRGYYHRPDLTAQRFVPDPFSGESGARLYRTGDLARYLPDGNIEFLGRADHQVKIRGYRIEPGEIESVLVGHPQAHQVAVIPVDTEQGDKRLSAYVVPIGSSDLTAGDLRRFLQERLPDYMVPSAFMLLEAMPLLPNGKVDRKSLPAPDWSHRESDAEYVGPRTPTEEMLAEIWIKVLGIGQVGIYDNFFELGGHSLLATQVVSQIREVFAIELPLRKLFEAPIIAELAGIIEVVQRTESGVLAPPIVPIPRDQELPLSFSQQRLWFLDQLEPGSPLYNIPEAVQLSGDIDVSVLERCLNEVVRRHEILRTTFKTADGKPSQIIAPEVRIPLQVTDLRHLPKAERQSKAFQLAQTEAQRPFDLEQGPLLRARLLQMGVQDYIILLTLHHIIGDDWSTGVLVQEISVLYAAFSRGEPSPLPDLPIQYADFAVWQRDWLASEIRETHLDYWRDKLREVPPLLELPTDRPRPAVMTYAGDYQVFRLPETLSQAVRDLCQETGTTLFMILLAAFQTLLYRYTGELHISVGTPIANRNRAELESLIGFFVNTLVLSTDFSGDPNFNTLLERVRETALGAYAHQDLPFDILVDELQPERNLSHSPLFQVMFVLQNTPQRAQSLPGLTLGSVDVHSGTAKFDLTLFMIEEGEQLSGAVEYNTDLFDSETIERFIQHFENLLESIVSQPEVPISQLSLLSDSERRRMLVDWNATTSPYPDVCAHQLFEQQVAHTPDAIAVRYKNQALTYAELDYQANQVAHILQKFGVSPETRVGLLLDRSTALVVGLLGVLKAGAAYLPLDPVYPPERLQFMVEDAQVPVLLTEEHLMHQLPRYKGRLLCMDTDWEMISQAPGTPPGTGVVPENLAYVIYTSGSTGVPKGAMLIHRGLVNYLTWCQKAYPLDTGVGSPVHSSISFDLTITSLLAPLVWGCGVRLLPEDLGAETLATALQAEDDFSLVKLTPAHLDLLAQQLGPNRARGRTRAFIIGGEALLSDHIEFWQTYAPETLLVNEYGPTETVVGCCVYQVSPGESITGAVPIGQPIINTQLYVLDTYLQLVPPGITGELYIGGTGVGRGYLNRPALTARSFIPNPFSEEPGARLYRTGDLVKYYPDGDLVFLGRVDHQVKIRGFRIELGEIEAALVTHPNVQSGVVVVHKDMDQAASGYKRLVAYFVPDGPAPSVVQLREFLLHSLPEYMVPAVFIALSDLPLTVNGKVDRKALPAPEVSRVSLDRAYVAPRNSEEETLARIWAEVLGMGQVGIEDNFFELGGDSILSIQVIARANQAGLRLTPKQLFEQPTVAGLALVAEKGGVIQAEQGLVSGLVPLTPIQHWFFEQQVPNPHHWNQTLLLATYEHLDPAILGKAVQHLVTHHDALRLRFTFDGIQWTQHNATIESEAPFSYIDISSIPDVNVPVVIESSATQMQASLDLNQGPLMRVVYYDLGPQQPGRLLIAIHHLVVDGVSWMVLLEDLQMAYEQLLQGRDVRLPPKTTAYKYWSESLMRYVQSAEIQEELVYWTSVIGNSPGDLPRDYAKGHNIEDSTESVTVSLSAEETQALLQEVPAVYGTGINDALLTALAETLSHWVDSNSVLVDLEGHGREDIFKDVDTSRTVGWFTVLFPLRLSLEDKGTLGDKLLSIKQQLRDIPQHGIGYGLLRYLNDDREQLSALPEPELSFNYLGQLDRMVVSGLSFDMAQESRGLDRDPMSLRSHLIEVDGGIANGCLQMEWTYSQNIHQTITIEQLAQDFITVLRDLITHCQTAESSQITTQYTSSDFEDFGWTEDDLGDILSEIDEVLE